VLEKIVSGGQSGVDLAALDAAIAYDFEYGGYCPKGRINENGKIPAKYSLLQEMSGDFKNEQENYDSRTQFNIRYSDGTLIFIPKTPLPPHIKDGTLFTIAEVKRQKKLFLVIDLSQPQSINAGVIIHWIKENSIKILNIAGPRESNSPGIYQLSYNLLEVILTQLKN
jgi:hypothetical protein